MSAKSKSFMKRHPVWTGIIIFFTVIFIIGIFAPDDSSNENSQNIDSNKNTQLDNSIIQEEETETSNEENTGQEVSENLNSEKIKLANWNLRILGDTKASNSELMKFYSSVIDDYDIIFVQEIRDIDTSAFYDLCGLLEGYECKASSRAGRTSSKEQYGVIYREGIQIKNFKDFNPDSQDRWERPPIEVTFDIGGYELIVYNIHIKPDDVSREMDYLAEIVKTSGNVVVIGDLNADCNYYDNSDEEEFDSWNWLISDSQDTTSSSTNCAYDRIILNDDANAEATNHGIYSEGITKEVSDHYLVWVEFSLEDISIDLEESPVDPNPSYIPKQEEEEDTSESSNYVCSSDYYNCGDFNSHSEAQAVFDYCKSQGKGDIHRLDHDSDNDPCENLS